MDDLVGKKLGPYTIRRVLGRGGMAAVYLGYHEEMNREVAIKVLPREVLHDESFRARFRREAQTIAALEHPAIVPVYDFGEVNNQPYLVMRYMPGGSLADRLQQGPLPLEETLRIFERMGAALDAAHMRGIVHRDIKPANILFDAYGEAHLSDFGIAKLSEATVELTGSGIVGTPAYIAPEMAQPGGVSPQVDVYALGVTLFQALTGSLPYLADTPMGLLLAHISQPVPDIAQVRPDLPRSVQRVIARALAKDPADRYAGAGEMAADLRAALTTAPAAPDAPATLLEDDLGATLIEPETIADIEPPPPAHATPAAGRAATARRGAPAAPTRAAPARESAPRRGLPLWLLIAGGVGTLACVIAAVAGGLALAASRNQPATPDAGSGAQGAEIVQTPVTLPSETPAPPGVTPLPTDPPTGTPLPPPTATATSPYPPVEVQPYCAAYNNSPVYVDAGHPVLLVWAWTATEERLIWEHVEAGIYRITLDGQEVQAVRRSDITTNDQGHFVIKWYAEPVILPPGTHEAARALSWTRRITDGWDTFGPGGEIETEYDTCTIIVR